MVLRTDYRGASWPESVRDYFRMLARIHCGAFTDYSYPVSIPGNSISLVFRGAWVAGFYKSSLDALNVHLRL